MEEHRAGGGGVSGADKVRGRELAIVVRDKGEVACFSFSFFGSPWRGAFGDEIDEGDLSGPGCWCGGGGVLIGDGPFWESRGEEGSKERADL